MRQTPYFARTGRATPVVITLIVLNVAMFLLEIVAGGSTNPFVLHRLGQLETWNFFAAHQYWRLLTSLFLHYGPVHLLFNIYALYILGPALERSIGALRFIACYLISGNRSGLGVVLLHTIGLTPAEEVVGASGCIMGVVGAWAGFLLRYRHAPLARRRLQNIVFIVVIQTVFDLSTPQVSMAAHMCGLIAGLVLGLILAPRYVEPDPHRSWNTCCSNVSIHNSARILSAGVMPNYQLYNVSPTLPEPLEPLREMSFNLWWTWEPSARRLFRHLDPELWNRTNHNPVRMLQLSRQARLIEVSQDKNFLRELKEVYETFRNYLSRKDTYGKTGPGSAIKKTVAYFSAEFGFHESIPNYSGGLGILAGDHCKSASDLDLNFVAIGLLYRHGYFKQQIDKDGIQQAVSLNQNFHHLPIREVRRGDSNLLVSVQLLGRNVFAKVWQLQVGRVCLYLLDTDTPENNAEDRLITAELYGGDLEMRMRQEIVLGIGGVKALGALGIDAEVFHMNEGHSAFLALERIRSVNCGEETRFLFRAASRRGRECFYHAHTGSGGQRFLLARHDAPLLRQLRRRIRNSVR